MVQITGSLAKYPARVLAGWFLGMIALGTAALMYPGCWVAERPPLSVLDALFTSTSASCVTGLVVRSTGQDFSFLGQCVILMLIQLGGLGIMTITTYIIFSLGRGETLRYRALLAQSLGAGDGTDLKWILHHTLRFTLIAECLGFAVLAVRNLIVGMPAGQAGWHALFHTVSAFCNAGFALHDESFVPDQGDPVLNITIMALVIVGGIGFPVLLDIKKNWQSDWRTVWEHLHLHTKLMLVGTSALILLGTLGFLVFEWEITLKDMPYWKRPMVAMFHSVTCRTAGFNTVPMNGLTNATLFLSILLMIVGAGPGSTAGGFKVSTFSILVLRAWASFRGRQSVALFHRSIPREATNQAIGVAIVFAAISTAALLFLLGLEQSQQTHVQSKGLFLDATFEVISALGTVGLSTGLTTQLGSLGRLIIIGLMFIGRLGPITVFSALSRDEQSEPVQYASQEPLIG